MSKALPATATAVISRRYVIKAYTLADGYLVTGYNARQLTVSCPLFFDLLPQTLNLVERCAVVDRVDKKERMRRRDGQAPHRGELEVPSRVQNVDLDSATVRRGAQPCPECRP